MKISKRAQAVAPSATIAVETKAKQLKAQGKDILSFSLGEPDFNTPKYIQQAAISAMEAGQTRYTPTPGIVELRKAIANKLQKENGLKYGPEQIVVNLGAKHSIYEALQAVVDPGDEVILPAPYWVTYPEAIKLAGGVPVIVDTTMEAGYKITPAQLKKAINKKTVMMILNSPSNPGGFTYTGQELAALAEVLKGTNVMVMSDEVYERLVYGDTKFVSFASLSEDAYNRTLTVNGFSKAFAMTGWRMGYTAGPASVIDAMGSLQSHMTQNAVSFIQYAALKALEDPNNEVEAMRKEFEKRGIYLAQRLNAIEGIKCHQPTGAFYCFPDVSSHFGRTIGGKKITGSLDFADALLEQVGVAIVPGVAFGCDKNIRLSFACSIEQITKGLDRIEQWLKK